MIKNRAPIMYKADLVDITSSFATSIGCLIQESKKGGDPWLSQYLADHILPGLLSLECNFSRMLQIDPLFNPHAKLILKGDEVNQGPECNLNPVEESEYSQPHTDLLRHYPYVLGSEYD